MRQSVSFVLAEAGNEVIAASDGIDALKKLETTDSLDLILTDINMPNLDGIGLIQKVREMPKYKFIPILVLTTESQGAKMKMGKDAGATGWIVKPFTPDSLIGTVNKVLK